MVGQELNFVGKDIHKLAWLVLPAVVFCVPYVARLMSENAHLYMYMERGWVEVSTVIFLIVAIIFSIALLSTHHFSNHAWFRWWVVALIFGCLYFAGEEISWGQHIFAWETPQVWQAINDQNETNLHNISPVFDQIPRALLSILAFAGGVLVPLYCIITKRFPDAQSAAFWLWPTYVCVPAALLSQLVSWHEKIYTGLNMEIPVVLNVRAGEVKESLLALFIMIYVLSIWYRNRVLLNQA